MTVYTEVDDTGFTFQAAVPITEAPKDPPKGDIALGQRRPARRSSYLQGFLSPDEDNIYKAITEYLDEKRPDPLDTFIEEYQTDPVTTPEDKFVVTVTCC